MPEEQNMQCATNRNRKDTFVADKEATLGNDTYLALPTNVCFQKFTTATTENSRSATKAHVASFIYLFYIL